MTEEGKKYYEDVIYPQIARRDMEREIYKECDRKDMKNMDKLALMREMAEFIKEGVYMESNKRYNMRLDILTRYEEMEGK